MCNYDKDIGEWLSAMKKIFNGFIYKNNLAVSLILSAITSVSLSMQEKLVISSNYLFEIDGNIVRDNMNKKIILGQFDFTMFILFGVLWYFYFKCLSKKIRFDDFPLGILSAVYSLCMLIGYGMYYAAGLDFYLSSFGNKLKCIVIFGGYYILFYVVLYQVENFLNEYDIFTTKNIKKFDFLKRWILIFLAWLPYIIIKYPGGINYDAVRQIDYYYGYYSSSALANPPLTTAIFGMCIALWEEFDISFGLFFYDFIQSVIMSACFAFVAHYLYEKNINRIWINTYTTLVAVLPIYPLYADVMVKDNLFSAGLMLYTVMVAEMILSDDVWFDKLKYRVTYFISIFMMCTFRYNGIYILGVTTIVLLLYFLFKRKSYKKAFMSFGCLAILVFFINWGNNSLFFKLIPGSSQEAANEKTTASSVLDINLIQQMARVVCKYPNELDDEDKYNINLVIDFDKITEVYNPQRLDNTSHIIRGYTKEEKNMFMHTWLKYFFRHPLTYVEAILHKSFGFFYPGTTNYWNYWGPQSSRVLDYLQYVAPESLSGALRILKSYAEGLEKLPFIYIFENIGFAFWVILYCVYKIIIKKYFYYLISFVPILVNFAIVILGPVFYQAPRYGYPQVYIAPFLLMWVIMITVRDNEKVIGHEMIVNDQ